MQISEQLASQHISKNAIADVLYYLGRTKWEDTYNRHQLDIEPWATGIWVKQAGLISYQDLAEYIREITKIKASVLVVKELGKNLCLVQGSQQSWYAVHKINERFKCECMLYRCRQNRLEKECPQLFKALNQEIFCHHTVAACIHTQTSIANLEFEYQLKCDDVPARFCDREAPLQAERSDLLNDYYDSAWW